MKTPSRQNQRGDAVTIGIIVVLGVIIVALGYLFYQNSMKKDTDTARTATPRVANEPAAPKTAEKRDAIDVAKNTGVFGEKIGAKGTFNYPDDWTVYPSFKDSGDGFAIEEVVVRPVDRDVVVTYSLRSGGGIGGVCPDTNPVKVDTYSYEASPNIKDVYYVAYSAKGSSDQGVLKNYSKIALASNKMYDGSMRAGAMNLMSVKSGASICDIDFADVISLPKAKRPYTSLVARASIGNPATMDEWKSKLAGKDYETVKAILLSTKLEQY